MSKDFAEKMLDSMVDENGHCGERGLSVKQFDILSECLEMVEEYDAGYWEGNYTTIDFWGRRYEGNIGKYHVAINFLKHFNLRCTVESIDLRPQEEVDAELAEEERMRQLRDFSKSEWQLAPKKRADFELTLVNDYEGYGRAYTYYDSGEFHIYTLRDADGNCYVWKTQNPLGMWGEDEDGYEKWVECEVGGTVKLKATVKEHGEYKGVKQTVLTRAKVLAIA